MQLSRQNYGELVYFLTEFWLPQLKGTLMREYRQLTEDDRIEIYAMKQAGKERNLVVVAWNLSQCCEGFFNARIL